MEPKAPNSPPNGTPCAFRPGEQVGRYVILREAGRGGMGTIYQARDTLLRRVVALKVLPPEYVSKREYRERFIREAQAAAKIHHRNVVAVHDVTRSAPFYIVMEYLEGETLEALLKREAPVSFERALEVLLPVMSAVVAAHECRVIHRDLKPANIMLARERDGAVTPKVLDFGISKVSKVTQEFRGVGKGDPNLTEHDQQLGTPNYMAPEQDGANHAVGPWSDVYPIALMLYRAVTGRLPFAAKSSVEVLYLKRVGTFDAPTRFPFGLPKELDAWMERALAPEPGRRYGSVREMAMELLAFAPEHLRARWTPVFDPAALELSASDLAPLSSPSDVSVQLLSFPELPETVARPSVEVHIDPTAAATGPTATLAPTRRERALIGALVAVTSLTVVLGIRELRRGNLPADPNAAVALAAEPPRPRTPAPRAAPPPSPPAVPAAPAAPLVVAAPPSAVITPLPSAPAASPQPVARPAPPRRAFVARPAHPAGVVPLGDGTAVTMPSLGGTP